MKIWKKALSCMLALVLVVGALPTMARAATPEPTTVEALLERWEKQEGDYPGKMSYRVGKPDPRYQVWIVYSDNTAEFLYNSTVLENTVQFDAGKYTTLNTGGTPLTGTLRGWAGVKIQCPDGDPRNEFFQWLVFVNIDQACAAAQAGDTIVLHADYDDYTLNGLDRITNQQNTKNGPATVEYAVSPNITIPAGKNITLDLNGHTIEASTNLDRTGTVDQLTNWIDGHHHSTGEVKTRVGITVSEGASLTIIDSSDAQTGKIVGAERAEYQKSEQGESYVVDESEQAYHVIANYGTLTISDGITLSNPARSGAEDETAYDVYEAEGAKTTLPKDAGIYTNAKTGDESVIPPVIGSLLPIWGSQVQSPFVDVTAVDYYYDAVNWAVDNGITTGTGRYSFSPDEACTRAQAVTFLWRAAGSPAPKSAATPFVDVDANAYYAKAVAWAVESGITNGTSDTTFSPSETCTRAQIVTFLYRAFGRVTSASATFTDVAVDAYYAPAVAWAAANGITGGTGGGKFSPAATCTRAQIVTFLYRCCG